MTTLLTLKEAAARLTSTTDQVMGLVADGELKFINVGRGKLKPRYRFDEADIDDFIHQQRTRQEPSCRFSKSKVRKITVTTVGSKVIGLEELRRQRTDAKPRK